MSQPAMPPGWYPDPWGPPGQRYWDGRQWTPAAVPATPQRKPWLWVLVAVIAVPVLFFGGCAAVIAFGSRNASDHPEDDFAGSRSSAGIDTQWRAYPADVVAAIGMNPRRDEALVRDLAPGLDADVQIAFDVPVGTEPAALVLRDSLLSSGVKVGL